MGPSADRFATIQHAVYIASTYNLNGSNLTINVANGSYTGPVSLPQTNGSGTITLTGNTANPSLCQVTTTTPYGTCISAQGPEHTMSAGLDARQVPAAITASKRKQGI